MRAVLQALTGREAGRRFPVAAGRFSSGGGEASGDATIALWLEPRGDGWLVRADGPSPLRVNGCAATEAVLRDRDIVGSGRRLYRLYVLDVRSPGGTAPRRTIVLPEASTIVMRRKKGLSTVVTAPGRWGDVAARWYGTAVLRLRGGESHPEQLIGRLARRVRCHALVETGDLRDAPGSELAAGGPRLVTLAHPDGADAALITELWRRGGLACVLSPLETDLLAAVLRPLGPLITHPEAVRPLLSLPDPALVDALRSADAGLLFGNPDGWDLFCCPEMLPVWRRVGLPEDETGGPAWLFETTDCESGLVCLVGRSDSVRAADVADALARRNSLSLLLDAGDAMALPANMPVIHLPAIGGRYPLLITPEAAAARFDVIEALWGRGRLVLLLSGRGDREVARLLTQTPEWFTTTDRLAEDLADRAGRERLGGFQAVMLDPGDGCWAVFADPRPTPVWQRYGLPSPVMEGAA